MEDKKPFLVDVPVRVNIWIRPDCQKKQFEVLKKARPSVMFLISDGGRTDKEWEAINQNRSLFETEVDWDCTIYKLYEDKNNGLYTMVRRATELIWSKVDRCIFLEDDQIPAVCYFKYCAELLEKYKDDTRIVSICSMNYAGCWKVASSDYFFSERGPIWGQATWKRSHMQRDIELEYAKDPYVMKLLNKSPRIDRGFLKTINGYAYNPTYKGHMPGGEFFNRFAVHSQNQLYIIPKYNMMCNIGCTADAAHSSEYNLLPKAIRGIFNMKTYEYDFPLKHPKYMIADVDYKDYEEMVLGRNRPLRVLMRRLEVIWLSVKYKGMHGIFNKFVKKLKNKNKVET